MFIKKQLFISCIVIFAAIILLVYPSFANTNAPVSASIRATATVINPVGITQLPISNDSESINLEAGYISILSDPSSYKEDITLLLVSPQAVKVQVGLISKQLPSASLPDIQIENVLPGLSDNNMILLTIPTPDKKTDLDNNNFNYELTIITTEN